MTICIAARSGNDHIVVASDRMVTLNIPSTEFEQGVSKTIEVTNNAVAATAGSALAYTPIHINSQFEIKRKNLTELNAIAEVLRLSYVNSRNQKLEQDILSKIGISLRDFYASNRSFAPEIVAQLYQAMERYNYGLSILVAGVDSTGSHIYRIDNPGRIESFDAIGHCAIGSGELHAISTFVVNNYTPYLDLDHVVALTYEAKKRSEKAQGVGEKSDISIICQHGIRNLTENMVTKLDKIYDKKSEQERKAVSEIQEQIRELNVKSLDNLT